MIYQIAVDVNAVKVWNIYLMIFIVAKKTNRHRYMDCLVRIVHQKLVRSGVLKESKGELRV